MFSGLNRLREARCLLGPPDARGIADPPVRRQRAKVLLDAGFLVRKN
jgi:hypothetical protein